MAMKEPQGVCSQDTGVRLGWDVVIDISVLEYNVCE